MEATLQAIDLKNIDRSNWKPYRFDEIAKNISERVDPNNTDLKVYVGLEHIDSESLHIKRTGTPDDVNGTKLRCYPGDIIFGRRRAYQRKAAIATFDGFCSAHSLVLRANPEVIHPKLFPFFMHSDLFMNRAVDISVGSLSPTINWGTLKTQEFVLPPEEQQEELAELLWAINVVIEKKMRTKVQLDHFKLSLCKSYFESAQEFKKIKHLGKVVTGNTPSTGNIALWNGKIPFVTPAEINYGTYIKKTERFLSDKGSKAARLLPSGSILTVCIGSTIGKVGLIEVPSCTNQQINAIIPDKRYHPFIILHSLKYAKNRILSKIGTSAVPIINKTEFEAIEIPVIEGSLAKRFILEMKAVDQSMERLHLNLETMIIVKKALINQIFG